MKIKKRELILGSVIGTVVFFWLVVRVIFAPLGDKLVELTNTARLQEDRLKKSVLLLENKEVIEKEYAKYETYFSLQDVSDEEAVASVLREVEKISRDAGLMVLDMKPQKEAETDPFTKQYLINLKAEANAKQVVAFLHALHQSSYLISVEKMVLSPKGELTDVLNVSFVLAGVSFLK